MEAELHRDGDWNPAWTCDWLKFSWAGSDYPEKKIVNWLYSRSAQTRLVQFNLAQLRSGSAHAQLNHQSSRSAQPQIVIIGV